MNLNLDIGDNEYMGQADAARKKASAGGGPSFIASILDALGINHQVAKGDNKSKDATGGEGIPTAPKGQAADKQQVILDPDGNPVASHTSKPSVLEQAAAATGIQPPTILTLPALSNQGVLRPLQRIDPDLGSRGIIKPLR